MHKPWVILLLAGLLFGRQAQAAADAEDHGVERDYRLSATVQGDLSKQLGWTLVQTLYFDRDFRLYSYTPQVGLTWQANQWLALTGGYRLARRDQDGPVWIRHRLFSQAVTKFPLGDWQLSYRLRWQGDWRDPDEGGRRFRDYLRNQALVRYTDLGRALPYAAVEILHRLDAGRSTSGIDRTLYRVGSEVELTPHQSFDLSARKWVYANHDPDEDAVILEYALTFN